MNHGGENWRGGDLGRMMVDLSHSCYDKLKT